MDAEQEISAIEAARAILDVVAAPSPLSEKVERIVAIRTAAGWL